jgi:hypothetical protein
MKEPPTASNQTEPGLSKLSSVRENNVEVDVILGELNGPTDSFVHQGVQRLPE